MISSKFSQFCHVFFAHGFIISFILLSVLSVSFPVRHDHLPHRISCWIPFSPPVLPLFYGLICEKSRANRAHFPCTMCKSCTFKRKSTSMIQKMQENALLSKASSCTYSKELDCIEKTDCRIEGTTQPAKVVAQYPPSISFRSVTSFRVPSAYRFSASAMIFSVALTPHRLAPTARADSTVSKSRMPPEPFTRT